MAKQNNVTTEGVNDEDYNAKLRQFTRVEDLGWFGLDDHVVEGFVRFDIMPDIYVFDREPATNYVSNDDILEVINKLLRNAVDLYTAVETHRQRSEEYARVLRENAVELTPEDIEDLSNNDIQSVYRRHNIEE